MSLSAFALRELPAEAREASVGWVAGTTEKDDGEG
jgi:hypothetical protein